MDDPRSARVRNAEDTILYLHAEIERLRAENTKLQLLITGTILPYIRGESLYGKPHIEELIASALTEKE